MPKIAGMAKDFNLPVEIGARAGRLPLVYTHGTGLGV
jgi:hypothetical protein